MTDSAEQGQAIFQNDVEGNLYSRFSNPNNEEFIQKLCRLGNYSNGVSTASGMAAVYTTFAALLKQGDHIMASKNIFGNALYIITQILPNMGIEYTLVEVEDKEACIYKDHLTSILIFRYIRLLNISMGKEEF